MSKFMLSIDTNLGPATVDNKPVSPAHFITMSPRSMLTKSNVKTKATWSSNQRAGLMKNISLQNICEKQRKSIDIVRAEVKSELKNIPTTHEEVIGDRRIMRFLRGHKYNIGVASIMYGNMLRWRTENNISEIRKQIVTKNLTPKDFPYHAQIVKFYPKMIHFGEDKDGRPIHIDLIGRMQPKQLLSCFSEEQWFEHHIYCMEYNSILLDRLSRCSDSLVRMVSIYDLTGLSMSSMYKPAMELLKKTVKLTQDYYPEMMDQCYLVNAPKIFTACWALVKPLLAERTVNKIQILGKNSMSSLVSALGASNLPNAFEGTKSCVGTPLRFETQHLHDDEYTKLQISKGSKETVSFEVNKSSVVVWGFFTVSGEIGFEILFKSKTGTTKLFDWKKCECLGGTYQTKSNGTLIFCFDNSFSWISKKHVQYYFKQSTDDDEQKS